MESITRVRRLKSRAGESKALGAYYTDAPVADFLARWAVRHASDTVMDPCFGGGVFLRSACKRLIELHGSPESQVFGVEIDAEVHRRITDQLGNECSLSRKNLILADFFTLDATQARAVDAIIGNPPFIRYQRFAGETRRLALARSVEQGIRLPELCSSWAPFVVHCVAMLRDGGRLAMVLPMEIAHAKYARPVLDLLRRAFRTTTFLTFREKVFPDLNEETVLLIAEDKGGGPSEFLLRDFAHPGQLARLCDKGHWPAAGARRLNAENIASAESRLIEYLIPEKARALYRELKLSAHAQRLGHLANIGIGYVTGANDFFHLTPDEVSQREISEDFLKLAVRRGRSLSGLRFTTEDWQKAASGGEAGFLLHIAKNKRLPSRVRKYLDFGESQGIEKAYKCRSRSPWFCVPHVYCPDAFLTYMSGAAPRLVANHADAYAPNSLHLVRLHPLTRIGSDALAALWQTSLTRLSVEIEGHALGGGMLKLEPTEAKNVLVPYPQELPPAHLLELAVELDELVRHGHDDAAQTRADEAILRDMMGLGRTDRNLLKSTANQLRCRRGYGEATNGAA